MEAFIAAARAVDVGRGLAQENSCRRAGQKGGWAMADVLLLKR